MNEPTIAYFGACDQTVGTVVDPPTIVYDTNGLIANSDDKTRLASPRDIATHDDSAMIFHGGSDVMAFHAYFYPEVQKKFSWPRIIYSGDVE